MLCLFVIVVFDIHLCCINFLYTHLWKVILRIMIPYYYSFVFRYVFEDQIEFIKSNVMAGENVCLLIA